MNRRIEFRRAAILKIGLLCTACILSFHSLSSARLSDGSSVRSEWLRYQEKISPLLMEEVAFRQLRPSYDTQVPVIIKVTEELFQRDLELRHQLNHTRHNMLPVVRSYHGRLTARQIQFLLASDQVEYVTLDAPIAVNGGKGPDSRFKSSDLAKIIGSHQLSSKWDGSGVTIAVFDSGIMEHPDLDESRVLASVDFTSGEAKLDEDTSDEHGHGTHVAGLIGGSGIKSSGAYRGVAPAVNYVSLRVVGPEGIGWTSDLIKAIDWLIDNKDSYAVRIANLSVGHPPMESFQRDPLCQAVERLVEAGIVTVVSAGNLGRIEGYPRIWGGITSPGNDPLVITVGAINTVGTVTHSDDIATTYSSRGSTYQDGLFKPDLCAPGNAMPSLLVRNSYLDSNYPELILDGFYLELSGSSMATGVVSGTVALMLQANPALNPNLVKLILLMSASKLQQPHMLEQGNGLVNAKTAVDLALALDVEHRTLTADVAPSWCLNAENGEEEVRAGGAFAFGDQIVYPPNVSPDSALFWGNGVFWTDSLIQQETASWAATIFRSDGVFWTDGIAWGDTIAWTNGVFWADTVFSIDGVFWTDFLSNCQGVFWTDLFLAQGIFWTEAGVNGLH